MKTSEIVAGKIYENSRSDLRRRVLAVEKVRFGGGPRVWFDYVGRNNVGNVWCSLPSFARWATRCV